MVGVVGIHSLFVVNTQGVVTGVGVGIFVFEGFGWLYLFGFLAVGFLFTQWVFRMVQIPGRRW